MKLYWINKTRNDRARVVVRLYFTNGAHWPTIGTSAAKVRQVRRTAPVLS